jgi:hypothetical protein
VDAETISCLVKGTNVSDNSDKPVVEFEITDLDAVWAPPDVRDHVKILLCTTQTYEIASRVSPATLAKLEMKLAKLREMQAQMSPNPN